MSDQMKLVFLVVTLSLLPLMAAPYPSKAQQISYGRTSAAFCGEVQAFDFFDQTFMIRLDDGNVEAIPFSRFTDFSRMSASAKGHVRREAIDPTEVTVGDRLHIQFDPSEATAASIEVLPARTMIGDARRSRP
jgi:hypothetical protein